MTRATFDSGDDCKHVSTGFKKQKGDGNSMPGTFEDPHTVGNCTIGEQ
jgi:hypothetical protein